jgi:pyruvate-ferredoxin/flavodoxin oxidoreductase
MENGVRRGDASTGAHTRARARDLLGAVGLAEATVAQHIAVVGLPPPSVDGVNAFGGPVTRESGDDAAALAEQCRSRAGLGERVALIAHARALAAARPVMRQIAAQRLGVVFHALCERGAADALALGDLGWGVVFASGVEDSLDLSLAARRAAEDSGTPFLVVHEHVTKRHLEPVAAPSPELCEAFLGQAASHLRRLTDPAHPIHAKVGERAFADRVPFALGSAMRELESFTGRRHDMLERSAGTEAAVMLVGLGALGDSLLGEIERLRAAGHDVGAVKITAYRPFPGARLVRALARALVVTIVEGADEPLAQSNPLAREVKAAFADALTWAPDYPGIGRIPRLVTGVVGVGDRELEATDIDAIVGNMLEGERGKRQFVLGSDAELSLQEHPTTHAAHGAGTALSMRGLAPDAATAEACAEVCTSVVASALALRARASVRAMPLPEGEGVGFDMVAARERPRGAHAPHAVRLVALSRAEGLIHGNPLERLARGGIVAVPTTQRTPDALWAEMPPYVKAIVFDLGARVLGFPALGTAAGEEARWLLAAAFAGVVLAAFGKGADKPGASVRAAVDGSLVEREVSEAIGLLAGPVAEALAQRAGQLARQAFEQPIEVPRSTIERDEEAVRLGRRDARASARSPR